MLALKLALGDGGKATNQQGALRTIAHQPFGKRAAHARRDRARRLRAVALRARVRARPRGQRRASSTASPRSASGVAYAILCVTAIKILSGASTSGAGKAEQAGGAACSAGPHGTLLVGAAGRRHDRRRALPGLEGTQPRLHGRLEDRADERGRQTRIRASWRHRPSRAHGRVRRSSAGSCSARRSTTTPTRRSASTARSCAWRTRRTGRCCWGSSPRG